MAKTWYAEHRDEINTRARQRYATDEEKRKRKLEYERQRCKLRPLVKRMEQLRRKYGLTFEQYEDMLAKQNGKCALCFQIMQKPFVDHDHKSHKVRALLCHHCNTVIGMAREDAQVLARAIQYLETHKES